MIADILGVNRLLLFCLLLLGFFAVIFTIIEMIMPNDSDDTRRSGNNNSKSKQSTDANKSSRASSVFAYIPYVIVQMYVLLFAYRYYYHDLYYPQRSTYLKLLDVFSSLGSPVVSGGVLIMLIYVVLDMIFPDDSEQTRRSRQKEAKAGARKASISRNEQNSSSLKSTSSSSFTLKELPIYDMNTYNEPACKRISVIADNENSETALLSVANNFKNDPIAFYKAKKRITKAAIPSIHMKVYAVKKGGRWQEFSGDESRLEDWLQRMLGGEITFIDPEDEIFPLVSEYNKKRRSTSASVQSNAHVNIDEEVTLGQEEGEEDEDYDKIDLFSSTMDY